MESITSKVLRLLALDLDDTLLNSDLTISHRTRNAIRRTEQAGVTVVLASGRILEAMDHFSALLGLNKRPGYLICNNGALILETHTGNVIHEAKIDKSTVLAVCDLANAEGLPVQMYDGGITYVSRKNKYSSMDQKATGLHLVVVENFRDMVGEGCYKLIIPGNPNILKYVETLIQNIMGEKITLSTSRPHFLELMPRDTTKGTALAKIAKILNIGADETMAIGDSMNDEAMIRWAGIGVAVANADERIKNIADLVTDFTNDDDGVAEIIEKYFFDRGALNE